MPHINELFDYTVTVFIVHEQKVLLVNHPRYDKWIPIGGHIEFDEDPEQALYREIAEETGFTRVRLLSNKPSFTSPGTKALPTPNYLDVHEANPPHKHISLTYFAVTDSAQFVLSAEHDAMRWFTAGELELREYRLSAAIIFYARAALALANQYA